MGDGETTSLFRGQCRTNSFTIGPLSLCLAQISAEPTSGLSLFSNWRDSPSSARRTARDLYHLGNTVLLLLVVQVYSVSRSTDQCAAIWSILVNTYVYMHSSYDDAPHAFPNPSEVSQQEYPGVWYYSCLA